ncbi:FIST domain containing protein [Methylococcaceae bacterium WWC4]|nr:FIST domain containing protein [Methylococcaceae bacterium WWC4]
MPSPAMPIRIAHSSAVDPTTAVNELHAGLVQERLAAVIFFCSADYDRTALAAALSLAFKDLPVVGCTTAGEIGPAGLCERSLVGVGFSASVCGAVGGLLGDLRSLSAEQTKDFAQSRLNALLDLAPYACSSNSFGFLLIDGLSLKEEPVALDIQRMLGNIPLVGGSAGDGLRFQDTWVYWGGAFHPNHAVMLLISTTLPVYAYRTQHFLPSEHRMVVTAADIGRRTVHEINGLPAAEEYARLVGYPLDQLTPALFAAYPVVVKIDGSYYVRGLQRANPDGSLTFYCAIEEGLVLRIAQGENLLENLAAAFGRVRQVIGQPLVTLGCDCILRKLEVAAADQLDDLNRLMTDNRVVGFHTYGEQFRGIHINQTFAAVAIGAPATASEHD